MRLLTHNFLACLKCESYPLGVQASETASIDVAYDAEFTRRMLARIDYPSVVTTYHSLRNAHPSICGGSDTLPETVEGADLGDESQFLRTLHHALNVVAVKEGQLKCPQCQTTYAITQFIPNFLIESA